MEKESVRPVCINVVNLLLTSNLVSHSLGLDDGDIINDSLVEVEILGQSIKVKWISGLGFGVNLLSVVLLNDGSGSSLDSLGSNSTHFCFGVI